MRWGYKRRDPDPIAPGLMSAAPRQRTPSLPRPHWHPLCWLRGHKPFEHRLRNREEQWSVFVFTCKRCHGLLDAKAGTRVTGNK